LKRSVEQDQPAKRLTTEDTRRRLQQQVELELQRTQHALQTLPEQQERERQCRLVYGNFLYALEFLDSLEVPPDVAPEVADHRTPYQVMVDNDTAYEELHQLQLERRTEQLEQEQQEHLEQQERELEREHREEQLEHLEQHREQERIDIQLEQHLEQQHLEQQHLEQDEDDTDLEEEEFAPLDRSLQEILHESNVKHLVL